MVMIWLVWTKSGPGCRSQAGTAPELMSVSGHRSLAEAQRYIDATNQTLMARGDDQSDDAKLRIRRTHGGELCQPD